MTSNVLAPTHKLKVSNIEVCLLGGIVSANHHVADHTYDGQVAIFLHAGYVYLVVHKQREDVLLHKIIPWLQRKGIPFSVVSNDNFPTNGEKKLVDVASALAVYQFSGIFDLMTKL